MTSPPDNTFSNRYLPKESSNTNCLLIAQVSFSLISITGLSLAILSKFSYLPPTAGYYGIGAFVGSSCALIISQICRRSNLQKIISKVKNFSEFLPLIEQAEL